MSDAPSTQNESTAQPKPTLEKPKRRRGKWSRRLLKLCFGVVLAFIVLRIGIFFLLAFTLRKVANFYDLDLTYDRQEITMLGGDAGLWDVKVSRRGEDKPLLVAEYVHGNLSVLALLRTNIEIWRMEADGVSLDVTRTADGKIPLLDLVMAQMNSAPVAKPVTPSDQPLELEAPFKIDALRLHRFRAKITDLAVSPAFHETVYADLRISDLRHPEKPTSIEADVWSDSVLSAMRFYGSGTASKQVVKLDASFRGSGLNLGPVAQYLLPLGLNPVASAIDWNGKVQLSTGAGPTPTAISAKLTLRDIEARADTREVVSVNNVDLVARSIASTGIALGSLKVDGVNVHVDRATNGRLRFAGIELAAPPPQSSSTTEPGPARRVLINYDAPPQTQPATRPATRSVGSPAFVTLDELLLTNLKASFGDQALSRPATIEVLLDELKTQKVATDDAGRSFLPIDGKLRAPHIASAMNVEGRLYPFESPFGVDVKVAAKGIRPDALRPYLEPLGVTSTLSDANLTAGLQASVELLPDGGAGASLRLTEVALNDDTQRLLLPLVDLKKLRAVPADNRIDLGHVEIVGPELSVTRHPDGALETLGFQYKPAAAAQPTATTQPSETPITFALPGPDDLPIITLDQLNWRGVKIVVEDRSTEQPNRFVIDDVGANLKNIVFNVGRNKWVYGNGEVRAWVSVPGLLGRIDVDGSTSSAQSRFEVNSNITGKQISLLPLAPYLAPLGLRPTMQDGHFEAFAQLQLSGISDSVRHELESSFSGRVELMDGERWLLSLPQNELKQVIVHPDRITVSQLYSNAGQVRVFRNADGTFEACGLQLAPTQAPSEPKPANGGPLIPIPRVPVPFFIDVGALSAFSVEFEDHTFDPPLKRQVGMWGDISNVNVDQRLGAARPQNPSVFDLNVSFSEADETNLVGWFRLERDAIAAQAKVKGAGLNGVPFAPYLPAGVEATLDGAAFDAMAELSVRNLDAGVQQVDVVVRDVSLKQGEQALAKLDRLAVDAARVDLANNRIDVNVIEVKGASARAGLGEDSSVRLPGLRMAPAIDTPAATVEPSVPIVVRADGAQASAEDVAQRLALARKPLPQLSINKLDVGLDHAGITIDQLGEKSEVALQNLRLTNVAPIQIGGKNAAELPPVRLKLETALAPLARSVTLDLEAAPFANEARFLGKLAVRKIEGKGLTEMVPSLATLIDGSELTDGSLDASFDAKLRVNRRTPTEFDLRRGFDGEVRLEEIVYRDHVDAQPVAGLESVTLEGVRVAPGFAGGTVKLLTVNKPLARVERSAQGIHVLGWTIKLPASETATTQEAVPTTPPAVVKQDESQPVPSSPTPGEFKIDRLVVSACDVLLTDKSVDPALVVPINALDVEVKGLTNLALVQDRPIRFSALIGADKVELPTRAKKDATAAATEMRPLLSQVTATGALKLYPKPDGYVKAAVNGFEMQSLAGESKAFGITVGDGIFDGAFDARFRDGGNLDLRTTLVVTDLKLSEQPNGLLQRTFTPGTPIDAAIGFAEDAGGSITFPLSAKIRDGELNMGSVVGSVIGGVSQVMITAIASAPAKLLQGMFGDQGGNEPPAPPITLQFLPGDASLEPALRAELDQVIVALRKDKDRVVTLSHHFSAEDAARASLLASPSTEQIVQLTLSLRARRVGLMNERARLAAGFAAELATGSSTPDQAARLKEIDREIVANDTALERVLDQTRPGAELQAERRMKAAAIDQANARLSAVRSYLDASKLERISERISVANPRFEIDSSLAGGGTVVVESITKKRAR